MSKVAEVFDSLEYGPAPEAIDHANAWLDDRGRAFGHFIKGEWTDASAGPSFDVANPATRETIARVGQASDALVAEAVAAARAAQAGWWALGPHGRARYLHAIARRIQKHARLFAVLETMDNGKPIRESRDLDIPLVARHFYHHAGWAQLMPDEFPNSEPVGVIGQIIPWNFPLLMMAWKIAPALAMGNTLVLKPAEFTPLSALLFAQLCEEVGLPKGVVNIITGDGATGAAIVAHDDVDKIAFTGSTDVGRIIREATAGSGKRLSLELGGKSPFLVFEDADLDSVVEGVVDAIWFNQGQVCCAGSRILVQEGVDEELERKLRARMETLRMGNPLDKAVDMGAIVAPVQLARIESLVEQGRSEGAQVWQPSWSPPREGWFYPPTLCTNVAPSSTLAQIEVFGPVAVLMTFRTPAEAVELANDTRYGLAASLWSENINLALDVAPKIKAGTVWVNCTNLFDAAAGFGGYRESGYGREGGEEGLHEYMMPTWERDAPELQSLPPTDGSPAAAVEGIPPVDRTAKLYVGGNQSRPDGDSSVAVYGHDGSFLGEVGRGNRKDVRNAVEAASGAQAGWASRTAHNRAQVLYYFAENLQARCAEFIDRLAAFSGDADDASAEFDASIERLFVYAAWADKWEGRVHHTPLRNVTLAMKEPIGVIGITAPAERPLLGLISGIAPAIAVGNSVVVLPSERASLVATDLYQVLDTSDVPAGVINIVTGPHAETLPTLAAHDTVDCMWHFGNQEDSKTVEAASTGNLKRTWVSYGRARDWFDAHQGYGEEFLREATQVKNIWVPYGA